MSILELSENYLRGAFVISVSLLIFIAGVSYQQFHSYHESQQLILQTHNTQKALQSLVSHISGMEAYQRSYIISGDSVFLKDYASQRENISKSLETLKDVSSHANLEDNRIDSIALLAEERLVIFEKTLDLFSAGNNLAENLREGNGQTQKIRELIEDLVSAQGTLLAEREIASEKSYRVSPILMFSTIILALFIISLVYIALTQILKKYNKANRKLKINNEIFEQAEEISGTGYWYYNFQNQELIFSGNQYRLFGLNPNEPPPRLHSLLQKVSRGDRAELIRILKSLYHGEKCEDGMDLKVYPGEDEPICMRMASKMVQVDQENKILIGVNKDLTSEVNAKEKLSQLNRELEIQIKMLSNAEMMASVGSYSFDFDTESFKFSDNLYRILEIDQEQYPLSEPRLLECIHPEDRKSLQPFKQKLGIATVFDVSEFRILTPTDKTKYLKYTYKFFRESGKKMLVVTLKDITEETIANKNLEDKNKELYQSNTELAEFNYVASHDLQEPLRKIQTFISRIIHMDGIQLNSTGEDYFKRIQRAANRMQTLIIDLLAFSRTTNSEKVFEITDLQTLVVQAVNELNQEIEEKNAIIHYDVLPTANVIPFQIKQLFVNLISNSLKYSNNKVQPEIWIKNEPLTQKDLVDFEGIPVDKLIKLSVIDNGIGFDQQYAESIFVLFKRLHNRTRFSGTGIGLSICKKVIDNHRGIIKAQGEEGNGANFTFILPVLGGQLPK
ncbi:CHASE3 domain-containing protein [Pleomorphovibrio marinus]|uniref:CHASE3 domain-containing protein n=1 Tax=Pleomorphovibrio marinus TaxID=2164132 RepID=UPI000E0A2B99|nr:CHASE3 domain-containing protein [Pleomorphovibrio marinus]